MARSTTRKHDSTRKGGHRGARAVLVFGPEPGRSASAPCLVSAPRPARAGCDRCRLRTYGVAALWWPGKPTCQAVNVLIQVGRKLLSKRIEHELHALPAGQLRRRDKIRIARNENDDIHVAFERE